MINSYPFIILRSPLQSLQCSYDLPDFFNPIFKEGLYLASPEFWQEFQKREKLTGKEKEKFQISLLKYWIRSCTRCTPYGTFAGIAMIECSQSETKFTLDANNKHVRKVRLDMNFISQIIQALEKLPFIRNQIKYYTNNSLYEVANGYRYADWSLKNNIRNYQLTSVEKNDYIKDVLEYANRGTTFNELICLLVSKENVKEEEAAAFIMDLCSSKILISELEPYVTGKDSLVQLINQLELLKDVDNFLSELRAIQKMIEHPEQGVSYYQEIESKFKRLGLEVQIPKNTFQVDLFMSTKDSSINEELIRTITKQINDLFFISRPYKNKDLEEFKENFALKYSEAEVPLAVALDAEIGIGYAGVNDRSVGPNTLIDNLAISANTSQNDPEFDYIKRFSLSKYFDYLKSQKNFIEITEQELQSFKKHVEGYHYPNSFYAIGSLMKKNGMLDSENFTFDVSGVGGPSAVNLIGRFTYGDNKLYDLAKEILKAEEEDTDCIYAEVVHLPQARTGNVLLRPVLRNHEIPYIGKSGAELDNQIPINDLVIIIKNKEVILRSKKYNKRVIPRLTTAHNFKTNSCLPIYKFLGDLQTQNLAYPNAWDWGHLNILKHLPRVVYKNLVIKKATWKIEESDIRELPIDKAKYRGFFAEFRKKFDIPEQVVFIENDNELLLNFTKEQGIELFLHFLKKHKNIIIEEFLFTDENSTVKDINNSSYTGQIIIPFRLDNSKNIKPYSLNISNIPEIKKKFFINSEWLYFKVYCGPKIMENVLKNCLLPFVEEGLQNGLFERFFFVRYKDNFSHLRIRFFNSETAKQILVQEKFMLVMQEFINNGLIDNIVLDTYERELERYGDQLVEEAEVLFFNDSLAMLRFIKLLDGEDQEKYRLLFALRGIDVLLNDFNLTLTEKSNLIKILQQGYLHEFGGLPILKKQLNEKYREQQGFIYSHMNSELDNENEIEEAVSIFNTRSIMNRDVVNRIISKTAKNTIQSIEVLLPGYIHMSVNRLFISNQRKFELVIYHFLDKYYMSKVAVTQKLTANL